jgi:hypothetical protein
MRTGLPAKPSAAPGRVESVESVAPLAKRQIADANSPFTNPPEFQAQRISAPKFWLLFSTEVIVFALIRLPLDLSFDAYAFADRGSFLTVCYLIAHGGRPAIDFGYPYGLLAAWLGSSWFKIFGLTPRASEAAMIVCALAIAWAFARLASAMGLGLAGVTFLAASLPFAILGCYVSPIYGFEAATLSNGLAEHASGRRSNALAFAAAACLIKPSMGYLYGSILLMFMLLEARHTDAKSGWPVDVSAFAAELVPAAATGIIAAIVLVTAFGFRSVAETLLPTSGREMYRLVGYGSIFHGGMGLWYQPGKIPEYYLFTVAGFWIAATLWLVAAGARTLWTLSRSTWGLRKIGLGSEFVLTCAILHIAFILMFFGGESSWEYYAFVLVMGVAATSAWSAAAARIVVPIAALALTGQAAHFAKALRAWRTTSPDVRTAGLWASAKERDAWHQVLAATAGRNAAVIAFQGAAAILFPQFEQPLGAYLVPKESLGSEISDVKQRIRRTPMIFAVTSGDYSAALAFFPEFRRLLDERRIVLKAPLEGLTFTVYGDRTDLGPQAAIRAP